MTRAIILALVGLGILCGLLTWIVQDAASHQSALVKMTMIWVPSCLLAGVILQMLATKPT